MTAEPAGRRGATGATTVGFHESPWGLPRPPDSAASPRWPSRSPPGCGKTEFPDAMGGEQRCFIWGLVFLRVCGDSWALAAGGASRRGSAQPRDRGSAAPASSALAHPRRGDKLPAPFPWLQEEPSQPSPGLFEGEAGADVAKGVFPGQLL